MLGPQDSIEFLKKLKENGFSDKQFQIVHFKDDETIKSHLNYVQSISKFHIGSNNEIVCKRLQYIVNKIDTINKLEEFTTLAKDAKEKYIIADE